MTDPIFNMMLTYFSRIFLIFKKKTLNVFMTKCYKILHKHDIENRIGHALAIFMFSLLKKTDCENIDC